MTRVQLTPAQMMQACIIGCMRQVQNISKGRKPRYGAGNDRDWQWHIEGCMGEMAVAVYFNRFWDGKIGELSAGDVGKIEVRTRSKPNYNLILHPQDDDDSCFILVTGLNGTYELTGWISGYDGKHSDFWGDPFNTGRPAYWVPPSRLLPMDQMKKDRPREGPEYLEG